MKKEILFTLALALSGCIDSSIPPPDVTGNGPGDADLPSFAELGACTHFSALSQAPYQLYEHIENPEYPFYRDLLTGEIVIRVESFVCTDPGASQSGHDISIASIVVEPRNSTLASKGLDFLAYDLIATAFPLINFIDCMGGEVERGTITGPNSKGWFLETIEANDDPRFRLTGANDESLLSEFQSIQSRIHMPIGSYFEINSTAGFGVGIVPGILEIIGGQLDAVAVLNAELSKDMIQGVQISSGNTNCFFDRNFIKTT
jgi:hypothetical protein